MYLFHLLSTFICIYILMYTYICREQKPKDMANLKNKIASKAMKAAWTNWKAGRYTSWSLCLKSAWAWAKKAVKDTVTVIAYDMVKSTEKAICIDGKWFPKSQIVEVNYIETKRGLSVLSSIVVPTWLFNRK
jgi:hypothetical protein